MSRAEADLLLELAETAAAFADGEAARRLVPTGEDDDYDVDPSAFNSVKRTLLLTERLARKRLNKPLGTGVWVKKGERAELVAVGSRYPEQFAGWNRYSVEPPPAMKTAFSGNSDVARDETGKLTSAFAPILDSVEKVAGVVEFCARL